MKQMIFCSEFNCHGRRCQNSTHNKRDVREKATKKKSGRIALIKSNQDEESIKQQHDNKSFANS